MSAKYVAKGKPAPDVYLEALRRLGCADAARALVVEDAGEQETRGAARWSHCGWGDAGEASASRQLEPAGLRSRACPTHTRSPHRLAHPPPRPPVNGLHAARAAGCFSVAVCTSLPAHMLAPHADLVVEHLSDLDLAAVQAPAAATGGAADGSSG